MKTCFWIQIYIKMGREEGGFQAFLTQLSLLIVCREWSPWVNHLAVIHLRLWDGLKCRCSISCQAKSVTHNWPAPNVTGFIAQLVEHRTGIARSQAQTPFFIVYEVHRTFFSECTPKHLWAIHRQEENNGNSSFFIRYCYA